MGAGLRSAEEMRDYLVGQLGKALHRTGAFGGETAFWFLFNHLAALEEREAEGRAAQAVPGRRSRRCRRCDGEGVARLRA